MPDLALISVGVDTGALQSLKFSQIHGISAVFCPTGVTVYNDQGEICCGRACRRFTLVCHVSCPSVKGG